MKRISLSPRLFVGKSLFAFLFFMAAILFLSPLLNSADAADSLTLAWDANTEESLDGYMLYYGLEASGSPYDGTGLAEGDSPIVIYLEELEDSSSPEYELTGLDEDSIYYFALTAFDMDGLESDFSDEVSYGTSETGTYVIIASATGQGSISPEGSVSVAEGDSQAFTITADTNYHVSDVIVDEVSVGTAAAYSFENVSAAHTIEAVFEIDSFTITASSGDGGTVSPDGETTVSYGGSASYTITPADGYDISDVTVDGVSVGQVSSYTFDTVTASHTIEATFAADTFTITASAGDGGSISPDGATTVSYGDSVTYTISAEDGYSISDVTVDDVSVGQVSSYIFDAVTASHTIEATFTIDTFTITASAEDGGSISPSGDQSVAWGSDLTFTMSADENYHVLDVLVDGVSAGQVASYTFESVSETHTIEASFEVDTYTVTASSGDNGAISPSGVESVGYGDSLTYTITPDENYHVSDVLVDSVSAGQVTSYTFDAVSESHTIEASFEIDTYTVTASSGDNGAISPSGVESVACGDSLTYTITPDDNYHVSDVLVDSVSVGQVASYTFDAVSESHTIEASFEIDTYTIVASVSGTGTITPEGSVELECGSSQVFTVTPDEDQTIEDVTVDGESVGAVEEYTFENIAENHTIEAVFVASDPDFSMEVGSIVMTGDAQEISFETTFVNPVVVAATLTAENADTMVVRIDNVTSTGFEINAESWEDSDDPSFEETIGYVVMEAGSFTLPDGTMVEAEIIVSEDSADFTEAEFMTAFSEIPATGATITSNNDSDSVTAVLQNITATGFEYMLQEQVEDDDGHLSEMVSYIAMEAYQEPFGYEMLLSGFTEDTLDFALEVISNSQPDANGVDTATTEETTESVEEVTDTTEDDTATVEEDTSDTEEDSDAADEEDDSDTDSSTSYYDYVTSSSDSDTTDTATDSATYTAVSSTVLESGDDENQAPDSPVPVSAMFYSADVGPIDLAVLDEFADADAGDYHARTEWQVFHVNSGACVLGSVSSTSLTECSVPEIMLAACTNYAWHARFYDNNGAASEWSDIAYFSTGTSATDLDGNGVPDDQEADASVDMNQDGISDAEQENVQSIILPSSSQPIGLSVEDDDVTTTQILAVEAITTERLPVSGDTRRRVMRLPYGLINFKLAVAEPGDMATVSVYFSEPVPPMAKWMKLDLVNNAWIDYSGFAQFSDDRMSVSIELVDGGFGDDDGVANGIIVDPAGIELASSDTEAATTVGENADAATAENGGSDGGCFISDAVGERATGMPVAAAGVLLILAGAALRIGCREK